MRKLVPFFLVLAAACGGDESSAAPANDAGNDVIDGNLPDGSKDAPSDAPVDAGKDSAPPTCDGGPCPVVYAFRKFFLGETDRSFAPSSTAWKAYGDDIDGKTTTAQSTDVCKRAAGAPAAVQVDGNGGIDNSFGANIMPIVVTVMGSANPSKAGSDALEAGGPTLVLRLEGLGSAQNYPSLTGDLYKGVQLPSAPAWDGTDVWPISSLSVNANDINQPKLQIAGGSMTARVYDSGKATQTSPLVLSFGVVSLTLPVRLMRLHATVSSDGSAATSGVISGVVKTTDMVEAFRQLMGSVSASYCSGSVFDSIAQQLSQASDILVDGTQDNTKDCDAISIGLGFEATGVNLGAVVNDPAQTLPCP